MLKKAKNKHLNPRSIKNIQKLKRRAAVSEIKIEFHMGKQVISSIWLSCGHFTSLWSLRASEHDWQFTWDWRGLLSSNRYKWLATTLPGRKWKTSKSMCFLVTPREKDKYIPLGRIQMCTMVTQSWVFQSQLANILNFKYATMNRWTDGQIVPEHKSLSLSTNIN